MKKIILTLILTLIFSISSFSQNKETPCPTITLNGHSDLITPGSDITFTAAVDSSTKIEYEWTLSQGEIKFGQNTSSITISTTQEMSGSNLTATVEIKGFPQTCANSASETITVGGIGDPPIIESYEKLPFKQEKKRLANVVEEFRKNPDSVIYFIYYYPRNTDFKALETRIFNVKRYLIEQQKIPSEKIVFVAGGHHGYNTIIYLVPSIAGF